MATTTLKSSDTKIAIVTGATSGIGKAIASSLHAQGMYVYGVGRSNPVADVDCYVQANLAQLDSLDYLFDLITSEKRLDVLVHSAGAFFSGLDLRNMDAEYHVNVLAPCYITDKFFPLLESSKGHVVFINSLAGLSVKRFDMIHYGATKHALKALADGFRVRGNPSGVRVTSVYAGQVATPMQEAAYRQSGRDYEPALLLQPEDLASTILQLLNLPATAEVTDLTIRSTKVPNA